MKGATDINGTSALETEVYTYIYGVYSRQLLNSTQMNSVLGGSGSSVFVNNVYDQSTNRLKASIRSGYSSVIFQWHIAGQLRRVTLELSTSSTMPALEMPQTHLVGRLKCTGRVW